MQRACQLPLLRRWSHIGRRPIAVDASVKVAIVPRQAPLSVPFGQTAAYKAITMSGPLGTAEFPIHKGIRVAIGPGPSPDERSIAVSIDEDALSRMSKYCQKFVKSMWGTTTSLIRQRMEGVVDVGRSRRFTECTFGSSLHRELW